MKALSHTRQALSRRQFLTAAGGITFVITASSLVPRSLFGESPDQPVSGEDKSINAWVHISPDGIITIYNPAAEMGQGSMTALPVLVAEEMDADWSMVQIEYSPIEPSVYGAGGRRGGGRMMTVGSWAVSGYFDNLRHAGAQVRYVLLANAAEKWEVPVESLTTEPGVVVHEASGKRMTYGEIASFARIPDEIPEIPMEKMKSPDRFRLIGKVMPRYDIPAKTDGSAQFAMDVVLPDMVYGVIARAPVNGARPELLNEQDLRKMPGVVDVVLLEYGVGIVTESIETAFSAQNKIQINWTGSPKAEGHNSEADLETYPGLLDRREGRFNRIAENGDAEDGLNTAARTYTFDYRNDYVYHAQMEPLNAVVALSPDGQSADVWAGTQAPDGARSAAARALGLDRSRVNFHPCYLGGGFGRRSMSDYVEEAAILAKAVKKPLKLIWTREDDVQYGAFRPMSLQRMQAGVDQSGNLTAWKHQIVGTGGGLLASGAENPYYTIPNLRIEVLNVDHGVRTKHWRAVGHGPNKYAIEAFIDEIALGEGRDPYAFRRELMKNSPRALKVLDKVAKMSDWDARPREGRAKGMAFAERSGSLAGGVCEISVDRESGQIRVHHFWVAIDGGTIVQLDNARAQTEGCIVMGLSSVLTERITFVDGKVQQSNFNDYEILRIADAPESIEVEFIPSTEDPAGLGEAGLPVVGGAVANAFRALTGKRLLHMPFTPDRVLEVLNG